MKDILLFNGGLDTELAKCLGQSVKEVTDGPLWCARHMKDNRAACVQVSRWYIRAGSDIVSTHNYQGTVEGFQKHLNLTEAESVELLKDSVQICKDAIKQELGENENRRKVYIAGVLGAYGASLHDGSEYHGEYIDTTPLETIRNVHKPTLDAVISAGADFIFCGAVPAIPEAELMLTMVKDYPDMKVVMSFSCKDDQHISHGELLADAAEHCYKVNPDQLAAVGINCVDPKWTTSLLRAVRERLPDIGLAVRPNSGKTYDPELKEYICKEKCVPLTNYVQEWIDLGATYIGGCCQTSPEDTKHFRQYLDKLKAQV